MINKPVVVLNNTKAESTVTFHTYAFLVIDGDAAVGDGTLGNDELAFTLDLELFTPRALLTSADLALLGFALVGQSSTLFSTLYYNY